RMALERAHLSPADIGLVVGGNSSPVYVSPSEATMIAAELGISAPCFDLTSACTTFGVQIHFLRCLRPEALPKFVLVVNPENVTRSIDYSDRTSAILFGDATTAAIVSAVEPSRLRFVSSEVSSDPSNWDKIVIPRMGYFRQDGHAVQGFAIRKTTDMLRRLHAAHSGNGHRFLFVGHQANLGMLATVCERTGIPAECHWHNVADYGNTACAGVPSVLSQHWDDLLDGDRVGIAIVGAGLTWANMMLLVDSHDDV
ncbi:MAG: 3-oxoacyl-[acyl-carrier-protein] synthase III C-terminal domain-containing protein, partial [Syntrophales bacterium]|nr:3-oxoacyl-[acyl-carrier-protein] synthase III C-terminal domain-containing protein [Syntrophales bacterium]